MVSQAGAVLLLETVRKIGLDQVISAQLAAPWRKPRAVHDPGKVLVDLALAVTLGGDCLADVAMLRCECVVANRTAFEGCGAGDHLGRGTDMAAGMKERAPW